MPSRPEYSPGRFYHFYNRGAHRGPIFREPENYIYVLRRAKQYARDLHLQVVAYCLLPNHYHFLIRQDDQAPARLLVQLAFNGYAKAYNRRYDHSGTLFEGSYKAKAVDSEAYALTLSMYIHANPVLHGLVTSAGDWPYSNYHEWTGIRAGQLVDHDFVRSYFATPADYIAALTAYIAEHRLLDELEDGVAD